MKAIGVIPARYASTRFPGKPLARIGGKSMVQRVYLQAKKYKGLDRVVVATDDERIFAHVKEFADGVLMTSNLHLSGTERCAEVVDLLEKQEGKIPDIVINIQGDEPFIHPMQISLVHHCFDDPKVEIATLVKRIEDEQVLFDANVVKVVTNAYDMALYFSRMPIPYFRGVRKANWLKEHTYFKHIGLYGYRTKTLRELAKLRRSALEKAESLEQLRWLEHGFVIQTAVTERESISVDTPGDLERLPVR